MKYFCWGLLLLPFFLNCATHAPMSEMVMFSTKEVVHSSEHEDSISVHQSRYSFGLSAQSYISGLNGKTDHANRLNDNGEVSASYTLALNSIFMSDKIKNVAFNVLLSTALGADVTFKVYNNYFATLGYTYLGGEQFILQQRMVYNKKMGASVGLFFETRENYFSCDGCLFPSKVDKSKIAGIRGLVIFHDGRKNRGSANLNCKVGYVIDYNTPYLSLGFSWSIF